MSELPKTLERKEEPEEVGAAHGEVTGVWRILRNGVLLAALALAVIWAVYA
jgi:hypothetical protein